MSVGEELVLHFGLVEYLREVFVRHVSNLLPSG
jgi:hypothetical protein